MIIHEKLMLFRIENKVLIEIKRAIFKNVQIGEVGLECFNFVVPFVFVGLSLNKYTKQE